MSPVMATPELREGLMNIVGGRHGLRRGITPRPSSEALQRMPRHELVELLLHICRFHPSSQHVNARAARCLRDRLAPFEVPTN